MPPLQRTGPVVILVAFCALASGCGQRGPLVLPSPPASASPAPPGASDGAPQAREALEDVRELKNPPTPR